MFSRQKNNAAKRFAIDPGAFRTRFYSANRGLLLDQPSIATLDMDHPIGGSKAVVKFGDEAEAVNSQGLDGLRKIRPVQFDQRNDLGLSAKMLSYFLNQATQSGLTSKTTEILLLQHHDCSQSISRQLQKACRASGAKNIQVIDAALAAFYSTELTESDPCIMIDFGTTATRVFAVAGGEVLHYQNLSCGGDAIDQAIAAGLLERFSLQVSEDTAREIKHSVAAATPQSIIQCTRSSCQVDCLSVKTNTMTRFRISSETINDILQPTLARLSSEITTALSRFDSSITQTAYETGIRITGGGALLPRMDQLVIAATGLPVESIRRPLNSSVRGAASTMVEDEPETYEQYLDALG